MLQSLELAAQALPRRRTIVQITALSEVQRALAGGHLIGAAGESCCSPVRQGTRLRGDARGWSCEFGVPTTCCVDQGKGLVDRKKCTRLRHRARGHPLGHGRGAGPGVDVAIARPCRF
jgi:hypothetical protein